MPIPAQAMSSAASDSVPPCPALLSISGSSSYDDDGSGDEDHEFLDPVTRALFIDPVVASDGNTYDRCVAAAFHIESHADKHQGYAHLWNSMV